MGRENRLKKVKARDVILFALEKAVDGYVRFEDFAYNSHIYARGYERPLKKSELSLALYRLRKQGFVEKAINEEKVILKLTIAGQKWVAKNKDEEDIKWDGLWRIVIFDIPEKHRRVRNILRRRLKEWGFKVWQKSVWACKKPLTNDIRKLVKDLGIEEWVLLIESANTGK